MDGVNIEHFWANCEAELEKYTVEFNNKMGLVGFNVEYPIVDKNLIGVGYGLRMSYIELTLHHADVHQ